MKIELNDKLNELNDKGFRWSFTVDKSRSCSKEQLVSGVLTMINAMDSAKKVV